MPSREALREQGEAMRRRLFGDDVLVGSHPDFDAYTLETTYGAIWSRPGLSIQDRMICTLAVLCAVRAHRPLARYVGAALRIGLAHQAPFTIFTQIGIYAGFAASEAAIDVAAQVYRERGLAVPRVSDGDAPLDALERRGRHIMDTLHGARGVQGYAAPGNPFTNRLYPMTIPYGYGEIWHWRGLELRQRAMVSLAGFSALQLRDQLQKFGQSARNLGLGVDEICEAIIQTAPYSGYAPALNALRWLGEVVQEG